VEAGSRLDLDGHVRQTLGSTVSPMLSTQGEQTELRSVVVPETDITVIYEHDHETGTVDLLYVGH
jgi:hypothetical protein